MMMDFQYDGDGLYCGAPGVVPDMSDTAALLGESYLFSGDFDYRAVPSVVSSNTTTSSSLATPSRSSTQALTSNASPKQNQQQQQTPPQQQQQHLSSQFQHPSPDAGLSLHESDDAGLCFGWAPKDADEEDGFSTFGQGSFSVLSNKQFVGGSSSSVPVTATVNGGGVVGDSPSYHFGGVVASNVQDAQSYLFCGRSEDGYLDGSADVGSAVVYESGTPHSSSSYGSGSSPLQPGAGSNGSNRSGTGSGSGSNGSREDDGGEEFNRVVNVVGDNQQRASRGQEGLGPMVVTVPTVPGTATSTLAQVNAQGRVGMTELDRECTGIIAQFHQTILNSLPEPGDEKMRQCTGSKSLGFKMPHVQQVFSRFYHEKLSSLPRETLVRIAMGLLCQEFVEEKLSGVLLLAKNAKRLTAKEIEEIMTIVDHNVNDFNTCDALANKVLSSAIKRNEEREKVVRSWKDSDSVRRKRCCCVAHLKLAREAKHVGKVMEICDTCVMCPNRAVQFAVGWLLREASVASTKDTDTFIRHHLACMTRDCIKFATDKMEPDLKEYLLDAFQKCHSNRGSVTPVRSPILQEQQQQQHIQQPIQQPIQQEIASTPIIPGGVMHTSSSVSVSPPGQSPSPVPLFSSVSIVPPVMPKRRVRRKKNSSGIAEESSTPSGFLGGVGVTPAHLTYDANSTETSPIPVQLPTPVGRAGLVTRSFSSSVLNQRQNVQRVLLSPPQMANQTQPHTSLTPNFATLSLSPQLSPSTTPPSASPKVKPEKRRRSSSAAQPPSKARSSGNVTPSQYVASYVVQQPQQQSTTQLPTQPPLQQQQQQMQYVASLNAVHSQQTSTTNLTTSNKNTPVTTANVTSAAASASDSSTMKRYVPYQDLMLQQQRISAQRQALYQQQLQQQQMQQTDAVVKLEDGVTRTSSMPLMKDLTK